jgi:hypothetical protein
VGRPEGLCAVKGDPIPWVVQVVGKRVEPWVFGLLIVESGQPRGSYLLVDS